MNIDVISHIYPTIKDPSSGIFIQKEARLISSKHKIELLIPTVRALPFQAQYFRSKNPVGERFSVSNVKYLSIPKRKFANFTTGNLAKSILPYLESSDPDLLHIHWLFPSGLTIPKLKKLGKPIVLTLHGGDWYSNLNRGMDSLISNTLNSCDAIITVGKELKNDIINLYPQIENKIYHVPHGINTNVFHPPTLIEKNKYLNQLNWHESQINILCVANLFEAKGVDILIEALPLLQDSKSLHFHIVAPRRNTQIEQNLKERINELKLEDQVSLYQSMSENELVKFYKASDFLISPSRKEGFGLAIAEAISCGVPVVCTKSGGPEEIVNDEIGRFAEVNDPKSLAEQINIMVNSYDSFKSDELHLHIVENFSLETKLHSLNEIYSKLTQ